MRHPTMEDVAREASVSRALVSLVFRDSPKVSPESRERVLAAAARLGYRPNAMARHLASRNDVTIGVLLHDLHNPFFAEIIDGAEERAERDGCRLLYGHTRRAERELPALESLLEFRTSGLLLLSPDSSSTTLERMVGGLPVVVVGREVRKPGFDTVLNDDVAGAELAVEHLALLGHTDIAHVSGGPQQAGAKQRVVGYQRAMERLGLGASRRVIAGEFTEDAGLRAAAQLVEGTLPTAVFAGNDLIAVGLMSGLADRGIAVPRDVSVVGYDNSSLARTRHVDLTTIDQPRRKMGWLAVEALLQRVRRERSKRVVHRTEPTLVVRSSTAPPGTGG